MPKATFFRLPSERRDPLVEEAITEFADRPFAEASLSQIAQRTGIAKGSFYQYFDDKLDLYRWLLVEEVPRRKRAFIGASTGASTGAEAASAGADFWARLETTIERGMAFLVEHPRLARLAAAAADPTASVEVRGLHEAICEAGMQELRTLVESGRASGAIAADLDLDVVTRLVSAVIGPGLTDVVLHELGATLHEVLASDSLRTRLGPKRRLRLARQTVLFLRSGLGAAALPHDEKRRRP